MSRREQGWASICSLSVELYGQSLILPARCVTNLIPCAWDLLEFSHVGMEHLGG